MPGGNGVNRVDALQGIKTNLGFKMGTVLTAFLRHGDRFPDFGLTIRPVQLSGTTSKELQQWLAEQKIKTIYITPASPWENGFVESFHSRFRDECLNREQLWTLTEARVVAERAVGPLGYDSPRRFAAKTTSPIPGSGPDRQAGLSLRLGLPTTAQPTTSTNVSD
jgi:transposase InsO family protein